MWGEQDDGMPVSCQLPVLCHRERRMTHILAQKLLTQIARPNLIQTVEDSKGRENNSIMCLRGTENIWPTALMIITTALMIII